MYHMVSHIQSIHSEYPAKIAQLHRLYAFMEIRYKQIQKKYHNIIQHPQRMMQIGNHQPLTTSLHQQSNGYDQHNAIQTS